jgi:hypothetical protein
VLLKRGCFRKGKKNNKKENKAIKKRFPLLWFYVQFIYRFQKYWKLLNNNDTRRSVGVSAAAGTGAALHKSWG